MRTSRARTQGQHNRWCPAFTFSASCQLALSRPLTSQPLPYRYRALQKLGQAAAPYSYSVTQVTPIASAASKFGAGASAATFASAMRDMAAGALPVPGPAPALAPAAAVLPPVSVRPCPVRMNARDALTACFLPPATSHRSRGCISC